MNKADKTGKWKRLGFRLLGKERGRKLLASLIRKHGVGDTPFTFPVNTAAVKRLLVIFPSDLHDAVYQLTNAAAIMELFPRAQRVILAEHETVPLARAVGATEVVEYQADQKVLFSSLFTELNSQFNDTIDCCCLLTRQEDLPLLYLAGRTSAPLRVGYADTGGYPFINLRINPSAEKTFLPLQNCALVEALGWKGSLKQTWPVAEKTAAEINDLLRKARLNAAPLIGIDILALSRQFGRAWAEECISALLSIGQGRFYLYAHDSSTAGSVSPDSPQNPPLFSNLSIPQTAALLQRSSCVVSTAGLLHGLAIFLGVKAVGIFPANDCARYSTRSRSMTGIAWAEGGETVRQLVAAVREFIA